MNFKKAVEILKNKSFHKIINVDMDKKELTVEGYWGEYDIYDARKTINLARSYTSEGTETTITKNVKHYGKRKNRRATRDAINSRQFDKIPQSGRVKDEDIWCWD